MSYSFKSPKYSNKTLRKEITADSRLANIKAAHNSDVEKINKSVVIHSLNSRGKSLVRIWDCQNYLSDF